MWNPEEFRRKMHRIEGNPTDDQVKEGIVSCGGIVGELEYPERIPNGVVSVLDMHGEVCDLILVNPKGK